MSKMTVTKRIKYHYNRVLDNNPSSYDEDYKDYISRIVTILLSQTKGDNKVYNILLNNINAECPRRSIHFLMEHNK